MRAQERAQEQTSIDVEQIIAHSLEAEGGRTALEAVKDWMAKYTMKAVAPTGEFIGERTDYWKTEPTKLRIEQSLAGAQVIIGFDGESTWFQQGDRVVDAPKLIADSIKADVKRAYLTLKYKEKGYRVEYLGVQKVEEKEAHAVQFTHDGDVTVLCFDKETFLTVKQEYTGPDLVTGRAVKNEIFLSDYRPVENVKMPFKLVVLQDGKKAAELALKEIKLNPPLEDSLFAKPAVKQ